MKDKKEISRIVRQLPKWGVEVTSDDLSSAGQCSRFWSNRGKLIFHENDEGVVDAIYVCQGKDVSIFLDIEKGRIVREFPV